MDLLRLIAKSLDVDMLYTVFNGEANLFRRAIVTAVQPIFYLALSLVTDCREVI